MQTVMPITANVGPLGVPPATDNTDKAEFPNALRGVMSLPSGNTAPPQYGKSLPNAANVATPAPQDGPTAERSATATESGASTVHASSQLRTSSDSAPIAPLVSPAPANSQPQIDSDPVRVVAVAPAAPADDQHKAGSDQVTTTAAVSSTPQIACALQDIATSRRAAQSSAAAPMRESAEHIDGNLATPAVGIETGDSMPSLTDVFTAAESNSGAVAESGASSPTQVPPAAVPTTLPGNNYPAPTGATQHAQEVVLGRPAASRAFGLLDKTLSTAAATRNTNSPPVDAIPGTALSVVGDTSKQPIAATAIPPPAASLATPITPSPVAPDMALLGAAVLVTLGDHGGVLPVTSASTAVTSRSPVDFNIAASPGSLQFAPELDERVLWLMRDGLHEARLQLNPRELGPIEVRLAIADGVAQVNFSTQHASTAAAVQQSLPQLRELLVQQGMQLGQATVSHQQAGDRQAAEQQAQGFSGQPVWERAPNPDIDESPPMPITRVLAHGLIDAYA